MTLITAMGVFDMAIHKLEEMGFGMAPFRCHSVFIMPSRSLLENNPAAYYAEIRMVPQGWNVGTCSLCGTSLTNNYLCMSVDGKKFVAGCDCVEKINDLKLLTEVKSVRREYVRMKRNAEKAKKQEEIRVTREEARLARVADLLSTHGDLLKKARATGKEFIISICETAEYSGRLSERQGNLLVAAVEQHHVEQTAKNEYFGAVGDRVVRQLFCQMELLLDHGNHFRAPLWLVILRDVDGRTFVYKGSTLSSLPRKGEWSTIKFTIKEHNEYKEVCQTTISRPAKS